MNNYSYQSSGVKYGLILNPKKNNIVNDFEKSFDKIRAWPIKKDIILEPLLIIRYLLSGPTNSLIIIKIWECF